ncbi:hypothetical protein D910_05632, partial [Dendroctonus ponderosae]
MNHAKKALLMSKKILSPGDLEKSLQQVVRELEEEGSTIENQREEYCDIIDDEFYSDSDQEPEIIERNDYSSDSELSADEGEAEFEPREQEEDYQFFIGKDNKTLWISQPSSSGEMQAKNIIKILPGPKGNAKRAKTEIDAFNLYITDEMVDDIVANTNIYIENNKSSKMYSRERDSKNTTKSEIKALLGALILIGIKKGSHTNCLELWDSDGTGLILLRALYSYKRFLFLMRSLRFDNIFTRDERKLQDKLAPIRDFHQKFVTNCFAYYNLSEFGTIDEMLHGFRGRCSFVQYIPNKPAKYGIKMCGLCDAKTFYTLNFEIYCVIFLSTMHNASDVDQDLRKSLVNFDYNSTKGGVDTVDQMCASYSVSRITRRWPLVVFFRHLEIAGINARVIFKFNNLDNKDERRVFLRKLALELMKDHLKERALTQSLPKDISYFLDKYRNEEGTERGEEVKTGICFICGTHKNNRTKQKCNKCARNICKKHSSTHITCTKCKEEEME